MIAGSPTLTASMGFKVRRGEAAGAGVNARSRAAECLGRLLGELETRIT